MLTAAIMVAGCAVRARAPSTYRATIARVEERAGDFISPEKGHEPLTCISLEGVDSAAAGKDGILVLVLGQYRPAIHGRVGDRVAFRYPGDLPMSRQVDFDSLAGYRILPPGD